MQRIQQGMHDSEVQKVQRQCSFDILTILGDLGWSLMDIDTLPFGIALPIHEALHLLQKDPPSGAPLECSVQSMRCTAILCLRIMMSAEQFLDPAHLLRGLCAC
jgi:hypothetical protein